MNKIITTIDKSTDDPPFNPKTYLTDIIEDVPLYQRLQDEVARATGSGAMSLLELGTGTGESAQRVIKLHAGAKLVGIDESLEMLKVAKKVVPTATLNVSRLQDPLPKGLFDVVFSVLAVHHLSSEEKESLFHRVAAVLKPGGKFVLGDLIIPDDSSDIVTSIDGVYDTPSSLHEQVAWVKNTGLIPSVVWTDRDLAVIVGESPV